MFVHLSSLFYFIDKQKEVFSQQKELPLKGQLSLPQPSSSGRNGSVFHFSQETSAGRSVRDLSLGALCEGRAHKKESV